MGHFSYNIFSIMALFFALQILQIPRRTHCLSFWRPQNPNFFYTSSSAREWRLFQSTMSNDPDVMETGDSQTRRISRNIVLTEEQDNLLRNWRDHPSINPTLVFPTLLVSSEHLQRWIQETRLQPYLAKPSNWEFLHQIHPRIKLVQEYNETHKLLLLLKNENNDHVANNTKGVSFEELVNYQSEDDMTLEFGPDLQIPVTFRQLSFSFILSKLLPVQSPSAYEQIGHVAHFNLKPHHAPYGELIGQVLRETNPSIDTVVSKVGEVKGKFRTYDLEVLAGPPNFETNVVEHGVSISLDVADCYWSTRLSGERQELIRDIERSVMNKKEKRLIVADVFCGVGAVCLLLAKSNPNCTVLANDWNPKAIDYLKQSIAQNGLDAASQFDLTCEDAYDYLIQLGTDPSADTIPDHILMNFPLEAPNFLGALRWWSSKCVSEKFEKTQRYPRFHVYTFARPSDRDRNDEEEVAVNLVANQLLPVMGEREGEKKEDPSSLVYRRRELNDDFDAKVSTRMVRDVAPGKVVVCVGFSLTPRLIRYMQGDF